MTASEMKVRRQLERELTSRPESWRQDQLETEEGDILTRSRSVYVGNISIEVPEKVLVDVFGCLGEVVGIRRVLASAVIIDYQDAETANAALELAGTEIGTGVISVQKTSTAEQVPAFSRRSQTLLYKVRRDGPEVLRNRSKFTADKAFMLAAVRLRGQALAFSSDELRADKAVVLEAVKNDGKAIKFAPKELQLDPDVVAEASANGNPKALARSYYHGVLDSQGY